MKRSGYVSQAELAQYRADNVPPCCPILGHTDIKPVVDHDHNTGRIRGVVSSEGNALLGKIENFYRCRCVNARNNLPTTLRHMATYLEQDQGPLHPIGTRQLTKRFGRMSKGDQIDILIYTDASLDDINACKNSKERTKLYRKQIVNLAGEGVDYALRLAEYAKRTHDESK